MGKSIYTRVVKYKSRDLYLSKEVQLGSLWTPYEEQAKQFHNESLARIALDQHDFNNTLEIKIISI